jgi:serine protease Do
MSARRLPLFFHTCQAATAVVAGALALAPYTPIRAQGIRHALRETTVPLFAFAGHAAHSHAGAHPQTQGYLGVMMSDVSEDTMVSEHLKDHSGVEVMYVDHDGPAGKAGLRVHDVILQMNGQAVADSDGLRRMLHETPAGHTAVFVICRDGAMQRVTTQLVNREELERQAWEQHLTVPDPYGPTPAAASPAQPPMPVHGEGFLPAGSAPTVTGKHHSMLGSILMGSSYTGAMVETIGPQLAQFFGAPAASLMVRSVDPGSPAAAAGLRAGDVVLRANGQTMRTGSDWTKAVHAGRTHPMEIVILRDKTLVLTPDGKRRSSLEEPSLGPIIEHPTELARCTLPPVYWMI